MYIEITWNSEIIEGKVDLLPKDFRNGKWGGSLISYSRSKSNVYFTIWMKLFSTLEWTKSDFWKHTN